MPGANDVVLRNRISALMDPPAEKPDPPEDPPVDEVKDEVEKPEDAEKPEDQQDDDNLDADLELLDTDDNQDDDDQDDEEQGENPDDEDQALDAKGMAEKLGISIEDVYEIEFNYADGESLTLGQLKDAGDRARTMDDEAENRF